MFHAPESAPGKEMLPGIFMRVLTHGENSLLCEFRLAAGSHLPLHNHPQEQSGYLVSGRLRFFGDEGEWIAEAGSGWTFRGGVSHGADVLADSVAIEVFAPARQDYLEMAT